MICGMNAGYANGVGVPIIDIHFRCAHSQRHRRVEAWGVSRAARTIPKLNRA
jgi:hypothetical protein